MVGDGQEVFRVTVVYRVMVNNPAYAWGTSQGPRRIPDPTGATYTRTYGPYNSLGAARGQRTAESLGRGGVYLAHIVRAVIQKAETTWDVIE